MLSFTDILELLVKDPTSVSKESIKGFFSKYGIAVKKRQVDPSDMVTNEPLMEGIRTCLKYHSISKDHWPLWVKSSQGREAISEMIDNLLTETSQRVSTSDALKKIDLVIAGLVEAKPRALKSAEDALGDLRKLPFGKEVNGVVLSESHFALVQDLNKPSEWDIQIRNQNGDFLESSSKVVINGLISMDSTQVCAVKERYTKAKSSFQGSGRIAISDCMKIDESKHKDIKKSKGRLSIVIIQPGLTLDERKFYPRDVLAESVGMYEGVRMFANHDTFEEQMSRPERDVNSWVGIIENARLGKAGEILADAVIIDPDFKEKLELLESQGKINSVEVSHSSIGAFEHEEINGEDVMVIKQILAVRSVDFVTEGNAGGIATVLESYSENDIDLVSTNDLIKRRPDILKQLTESIGKSIEESAMNWEEMYKELKEAFDKFKEETKTVLDEATAATKEAMDKLTESEDKQTLAESMKAFAKLIEKTELSEDAQEMLTESVKGISDIEEGTKLIESQSERLRKISGGPVVKDNGRSEDKGKENTDEGQQVLIESFVKSNLHRGMNEVDALANARAKAGV